MSSVGGCYRIAVIVPVAGVTAAYERVAEFAVLRVHSRNVGVLARAGFVKGHRTVGPV